MDLLGLEIAGGATVVSCAVGYKLYYVARRYHFELDKLKKLESETERAHALGIAGGGLEGNYEAQYSASARDVHQQQVQALVNAITEAGATKHDYK